MNDEMHFEIYPKNVFEERMGRLADNKSCGFLEDGSFYEVEDFDFKTALPCVLVEQDNIPIYTGFGLPIELMGMYGTLSKNGTFSDDGIYAGFFKTKKRTDKWIKFSASDKTYNMKNINNLEIPDGTRSLAIIEKKGENLEFIAGNAVIWVSSSSPYEPKDLIGYMGKLDKMRKYNAQFAILIPGHYMFSAFQTD